MIDCCSPRPRYPGPTPEGSDARGSKLRRAVQLSITIARGDLEWPGQFPRTVQGRWCVRQWNYWPALPLNGQLDSDSNNFLALRGETPSRIHSFDGKSWVFDSETIPRWNTFRLAEKSPARVDTATTIQTATICTDRSMNVTSNGERTAGRMRRAPRRPIRRAALSGVRSINRA